MRLALRGLPRGNYRITFRVDGEDLKDIDFEDYHGK
jgi:hypothetical protein